MLSFRPQSCGQDQAKGVFHKLWLGKSKECHILNEIKYWMWSANKRWGFESVVTGSSSDNILGSDPCPLPLDYEFLRELNENCISLLRENNTIPFSSSCGVLVHPLMDSWINDTWKRAIIASWLFPFRLVPHHLLRLSYNLWVCSNGAGCRR